MLFNEVLINGTRLNDIGDYSVKKRQIGLRLEGHNVISQFEAAMLEG